MKRLAFTSVAILCIVALASPVFAQAKKSAASTTPTKDAKPAVATTPAPPSPELMKARMRPPVKGTASVEYIQGPSKPVKNTSGAPIVGFRIDQYFYKGKEEISAGTGRLRTPLADREIAEITVTAPMKPGISGSQMRFSHANGTVKPEAVKKFSDDTAPKKK
jgi:hypothetical protein